MSGFVKNFSYIGLFQLLNYCFPLITMPIIARALGPESLGKFNYIMSVMCYFTLLINYGFGVTATREVSTGNCEASEVFSKVLYCQLMMFALSLMAFALMINQFDFLRENMIISLFCFLACIPFSQAWIFQAKERIKALLIINIIPRLISLPLIILLIKEPADLQTYAIIIFASTFISSALTLTLAFRFFSLHLQKIKIKSCLRFMLAGKDIFLSSVVINFYTTTGIVILGIMTSTTDVGYYSAAQKIIDIAKSFAVAPVNIILLPLLARTSRGNIESIKSTVANLMPAFFLVSVLLLVMLLLSSDLIIAILYGSQFRESIAILRVLSFGFFAVLIGSVIGQIMIALNMDRTFFRIQAVISLLSITANYFILPYGSFITTAIVWSLCETLVTFFEILFLYRYGVKPFSFRLFSVATYKRSFLEVKSI